MSHIESKLPSLHGKSGIKTYQVRRLCVQTESWHVDDHKIIKCWKDKKTLIVCDRKNCASR